MHPYRNEEAEEEEEGEKKKKEESATNFFRRLHFSRVVCIGDEETLSLQSQTWPGWVLFQKIGTNYLELEEEGFFCLRFFFFFDLATTLFYTVSLVGCAFVE